VPGRPKTHPRARARARGRARQNARATHASRSASTANDLCTLPVALLNMEYGSVGQVDFGYLEAAAVIVMIPCILPRIARRRHYIRGLTSGVVKG
jgi:ABC-type glycerol-3-phosphate transport system permease component